MARIEQAQAAAASSAGVQHKVSQSRAQRREGIAIALTLGGYLAAWAGARLFFHVESYVFVLVGVGLLGVSALVWRVRRED